MTSAAGPPEPPGPEEPGPAKPGSSGSGSADDREPEERDPGLARERTSLSWTRTAIAFAAVGGAVLKVNVVSGLIILAIAPMVWQLGRVSARSLPGVGQPAAGTMRIRLITVSIVVVALLSLIVALLGRSAPGALR